MLYIFFYNPFHRVLNWLSISMFSTVVRQSNWMPMKFRNKKTSALANAHVKMHNNNNSRSSSSEMLFITYCEMESKLRVFGMHKLNGFGFVAGCKNLGVLARKTLASAILWAKNWQLIVCYVSAISFVSHIYSQYSWFIKNSFHSIHFKKCRWSLGNKKSCDLLFFVIIAYRIGNVEFELKKSNFYLLQKRDEN